jgi:hypothetical protein
MASRCIFSKTPVVNHPMMIMNEPHSPDLWKVGRITGWIEALMENAPQTFRSYPPEERMTILQEV